MNEKAVLKLLEAAWFRRIWVLQEVAAARHIVVRCGPAEIDGYAFFSGLSALKLPYEDYPGLQPLVMSVAYLAKGAAFRSRCTTSQAGRSSLNICRLGQLVDMYHNHQATDDRDRIYALLGMSSDDPGTSGLLVDYDISWAKLFKQLVHSILGSVSVDTWDDKAVAVTRSKGCVLGIVSVVDSVIDRNGKQLLRVTSNSLIDPEADSPYWELEASAEPVEKGDLVCLLQGAKLPTIIRMHNDYWKIIVISAETPERLQVGMSDDQSELPRLQTVFPYDFLLVWDWDLCLDESQRGNEYEDLMGYLAPKAPQAGLQTDCQKITRFWNSGVIRRDVEVSKGEKNLQKAIEVLEHILGNTDSLPLAGLGRDHRMMGDDMKELQRIVDLIFKSEGGWTPLCLAAVTGSEAVARLLLDTGKVDPNVQDDWEETPLLKASEMGHERIVKLLLSTETIDPDARGDKYRRTPLAEAAKNGHEAIVKMLINTGKVEVNTTSFFRMTPLMHAAENGHTAVVELLLSTPEVEPDFGFHPEGTEYTALSLAVRNGHEEIVELLLGVGQVPLDLSYYKELRIPES
ncbi:acb 4-hydroxyacetophenone monooxygenase [Fusarium flagelliforme]|uniref:Acb 4-hydroxyacetophenone monooxygenase n=1 Tax=Fusarium flagelliforme TaxID=2675880 RepID=A0A395MB02_9HYPO|nr:acb 4-hydroxyacetophenone monooxygenase [Fusarium flagelliforme]